MIAVYASTNPSVDRKQRVRQMAAIAIGIVLVPLIMVTGSRAGMVVSVPALLSAALLYRRPVGRSDHKSPASFVLRKSHIIAASAVISLAFLAIVFARAEAFDRFFEQSAFEDSRTDYWQIGLQMAWQFFPVGSGAGSFVETYQIYEPDSNLSANYVNHLHNDWLEIWLTMGLPGVLLLLAAVILFWIRVLAIWRRNDAERRAVRFARLASVLIIIIAMASFGDYPLRTPIMLALFALFSLWLTSPALLVTGAAASAAKGQYHGATG
jgi:O-antigen ligase